ncbi:MAG TPA: MerR family transcriptional regulator [Puia sp.]|nr:MerR family transcriptional regulator [Puia sp.]
MKKVLPQIAFDFGAPPEEQVPSPVQVQEEAYPAGVGVRLKSLKHAGAAIESPEPVIGIAENTGVDRSDPPVLEIGSLQPAPTDMEAPGVGDMGVEYVEAQEAGDLETGAQATAIRPVKVVKSKRGRKSLKQATAEADLIQVPADEILFSKHYYTMGEVAEMFRVNQSLLRFWETEFNILQPKKNKKGDRHFRPVDIKNLHLIYHLLRQRKYTIEGAKEFLKKNKKAEERFEAIKRLQQIRAFLLELKAQA